MSVPVLVQGTSSPVVFFLRTFLHICLLSTALSFHAVPLTRGASLSVHNRQDFASRWVWCENICSSREHIFLRTWHRACHQREAISVSFSHPLTSPSIPAPTSAMPESWVVSIWVENVPAFLTLSLTDCLINLLILSIVDLGGVLERRAVDRRWSLSFSFA